MSHEKFTVLKKLFFLVLLLIGFTITAPASDTQKAHYCEIQQDGRRITGKVIDENGETLIGVSVMVKGTNMGIVTNVDGNYVLNNVPGNATLVFSFVGMSSQEILVGNQTNINVTMKEESIGLEEVVAIGYGTRRKVNLTGSVTSITSKDLKKRSVTQSSLLLQGKMSGIPVRQSSVNPAENNASLLIRGQNTIISCRDIFCGNAMIQSIQIV